MLHIKCFQLIKYKKDFKNVKLILNAKKFKMFFNIKNHFKISFAF